MHESLAARLLRSGREALSDAELLAVLLGGGRGGDRPLKLARGLLEQRAGLSALATATPAVLRIQGIPEAGAATLLATVELATRLARQRLPDSAFLSRPALLARYLVLRYHQRDQEIMGALFLNVRDRLIGEKEIFRGTLHRAAVEPREILKECLLRGAARVALFHTHPSGDPTPSDEDLLFTRRMAEAATIVGVELVDHLVLGGTGRWVSLRERGAW
jgi:DNA repair protein RadC